jgi:hypothetical protein
MKHILTLLLFAALCLNSWSQTEIPKIGYYGRASVGVLTGEYSSVSLNVANGISVGHVDLGLGLGLEVHDQSTYAPILVESRYNFGKGATQPFIGVGGGYLAAVSQINNYQYQGGYTLGANIGMTHYFSKHFGITTTLGYRFSYTHNRFPEWMYVDPGFAPDYNVIRDMHRIEVRLGVAFR